MNISSLNIKRPSKFYSPLRYPGGKANLASFFFSLMDTNKIYSCTYVEPFAGGAGAGLTLLFLERVDKIIINDLDRSIYALWYSILNYTDMFVEKLKNVELSINEWRKQWSIYTNEDNDLFQLGFATFYLNRTNRSGIIKSRPIGGMSQAGQWSIGARFNKKHLINRIIKIANYKERIFISNIDGIELMENLKNVDDIFFYIDPPYYMNGSTLYYNYYTKLDHAHLANFLNSHNDLYWILTYDNVEPIKKLYAKRRVVEFTLRYHINSPKKGSELMIFSDKFIIPT